MKPIANIMRRLVHSKLRGLTEDAVLLLDEGRATRFGAPPADARLSATIEVHDARFYGAIARRGSIGAAEAFISGWWSCDDLVALIRIMARALAVSDKVDGGITKAVAPLLRAWHRTRRNTRDGSRRNIHEHYDLGNDFFEKWLDPTMTYSAGIYESERSTLEEASRAKLDRACRKLQLEPTDRVLEIGTGWGSFAMHAAREYGCHVTTTTISKEQHDLARRRIAEAGLADRIDVLLSDYRDLRGTFDKIVSLEMIEAVGHDHHPTFLRRCQELLAEDGQALLQVITMADARYEQAIRSVDFIQRYIFPGSCLPSITRLCNVATRATDLRLTHLEDITPHYVRTLADWRQRFLARREDIRALGYDDRFLRMWEFYLAYCEGGFAERTIGDIQVVFSRPRCRSTVPLPSMPALADGAL